MGDAGGAGTVGGGPASGADAGAPASPPVAAAAPPSTPSPAAPPNKAAAPAAAAPPTPLEQRQWRRGAQTAVRVALTAVKAARSHTAEASAAGVRDATDFSNRALALEHLPARPLGALVGEPGLLQAAAAKLCARRGAALARLEGDWGRLAAAAEDMRAAVESAAAEATHDGWRAHAPVFASIQLPAAASMLSEVAAMHEAEAAAKRALLDALAATAAAQDAAAAGGGSGDLARVTGTAAPDTLRERLTVAVAAWLARPGVDDERADLLLAALHDDMAGF